MTRILRSGGRAPARRASPERTRVLRATQLDSLRQAESRLEAVRREADQLLERARSEAEAIRRRAREESETQAAALLARAQARSTELTDAAQADLTSLAVRIAEKILGEELRLHPERVAQVVQTCLRDCRTSHRVVIRLNPADLPLIEAELLRLGGAEGQVLLPRADSSIDRGGCVLETDLGQMDGRLQTQLAAIREAIGK